MDGKISFTVLSKCPPFLTHTENRDRINAAGSPVVSAGLRISPVSGCLERISSRGRRMTALKSGGCLSLAFVRAEFMLS